MLCRLSLYLPLTLTPPPPLGVLPFPGGQESVKVICGLARGHQPQPQPHLQPLRQPLVYPPRKLDLNCLDLFAAAEAKKGQRYQKAEMAKRPKWQKGQKGPRRNKWQNGKTPNGLNDPLAKMAK